jgi:4-nitrophenyl phosphatase
VFDLDGVLFRGETVIDAAPRCIAWLREQGVGVRFLTNNSSQPRQVYVEKLGRMGMPCTTDDVVTSASATALFLASRCAAVGRRVFAVGGPGIRSELAAVGIGTWTVADEPAGDELCEYVVAGLDRDFSYKTLLRAQQCILRGARFIATNRDTQYPTESGVIPGGGSIVAAIAAAAESEPETIGKPEPLGMELLLEAAGIPAAHAVMVGDRPDTDILCARRAGVASVLVLTGVTTREQAANVPLEQTPDHVVDTLDQFADLFGS